MNELKSVFEIVDITDYEMYFPKSIHLTKENAVKVVDSYGIELCDDAQEYIKLEIRERKINSTSNHEGVSVYLAEWEENWSDDKVSSNWERINL